MRTRAARWKTGSWESPLLSLSWEPLGDRLSLAYRTRCLLAAVELGAPARDLLRGEQSVVAVVLLPLVAVAPPDRRLQRGARLGGGVEQRERELERHLLRTDVVRLSGAVPQRKIAEQEPRDAAVLDDVLCAAHHDRGDAVRLQMAR